MKPSKTFKDALNELSVFEGNDIEVLNQLTMGYLNLPPDKRYILLKVFKETAYFLKHGRDRI